MLNFSSRTSSLDVQRTIEASVEKRTKNIFGPPIGKRIAAFIDDMNMPQVDSYGTQQPIALLKLFFEKGGMFGRDKDLNWKKYNDMTFFAAMGCAGGGRNDVDTRFISMFSVFSLMFPEDNTLRHIYSSILTGHLVKGKFADDLLEVGDKLVDITLTLFKIVVVELPPTPSKFHYIFNLKDLSRIYAGMLLIHNSLFSMPKQLVRVWRNELTRVICDRLINASDIDLMNKSIRKEIETSFITPPPKISLTMIPIKRSNEEITVDTDADDKAKPAKTPHDDLPTEEYALRDPLLFGDYRNTCNPSEPRYYEDLLDYEAIFFLFQEV